MRQLNYIIFFLFSIVFTLEIITSCHFTSDETECLLQRAEQCMEMHPDTALHLLESISEPQRLESESLAHYYLLLTQARDKNYMDLSTDSSIVYSVNYFKKSGDLSRYGKSMYYYGRVFQMGGDQLRAMRIYLDAHQALEDAGEYKILGLMSEDMSIFNRNQSLYDRAVRSSRDAIHYYHLVGDTVGVAFAHQTLGEAFFMKQELDSAFKYASIGLHLLSNNPIRLKTGSLKLFTLIHCQKGEYAVAESMMLDIVEKECDDSKMFFHYITLGQLYKELGRVDEAKKYLMLCLGSPNLLTRSGAYTSLAKLSELENDYKEAYFFKQKADSLEHSFENHEKRETLERMQSKYMEEKFLRENLELQLERKNILLSSILVFISLVICVYYLYRKYSYVLLQFRRTGKRLEKSKGKLTDYKKKIKASEREKAISDTLSKETVRRLEKENTELKADLFRSHETVDVGVLIKKLKQDEIIAENMTTEEWDRIFNLVNGLYNNALIILQEKYVELTNRDIRILSLLLLSFSSKEIVTIYEFSDGNTLSKIKLCLKERLGNLGKGNSLDLFIENCRKGKL